MANIALIEEYARKLEQEQMDVADATHSDPNSAEEGRRQFYENNPAMKRYRHRQAQGKAIKQPDDWVGIEGFRFSPSAFAKGYQDWDIGKQISATIGGGQRLIGEHLGYPSLVEKAEEEERLRKQYEEAFASDKHTDVTAAVDFPGTWGDLTSKDVGHFDESVVPMAAAAPVGAALGLAGVPALATGIGSAVLGFAPPIAAKMYGDERSQGLSPDEALVETALKTSYEALPETLPFLKMFGPLGKNVLTKIASVATAESASEILTEALNIGHEIIRQGRTPTLEEVGQRLSKSAAMGFTMGTGFGTASAVPEAVRAVSNMGGTVPPVAPDGMPNLPALPQGPAQDVGPSATQEPYRTPPSFGPVDPSRRQFLQNMGDIATVAATTPTDLLPNLAEAAPAAVETAAPVVQKLSMDYLNLPMPTDYVFDINGKTLYAMTPDHIDIEQGETFVQFTDEMGGDDLPGGVSNVVDIGPYLDPVEDISQRDVDKAVARAIQDTFVNEGDEFFLGDVRRYYDEAGDGAEYASPFDIQRMEAQNDPEGIFDEVMLQRGARRLGTNRDDKRLGGYSRIESKPTEPRLGGTPEPTEPRVPKRPILRDPSELEDSNWQSPFEAEITREAEKLAEQDRIEELARDREVTKAIPPLPELQRMLSEARDRLKRLEAGLLPEGFEEDFDVSEIEEYIALEKDNIATLEEEVDIKSEEPLEGKYKEDPPALSAISLSETTRKDPDGKILRDAIRFLKERGLTIPETRDQIYHKAWNRRHNEQLSESKRNLKKMREYLSSVANTAKHEPRRKEARKMQKELANDNSLMTDSDFLSRLSNLRVLNSKNSRGFGVLPDQTEEGPPKAWQIRRQREQDAATAESLTPAGQMALRAFGMDKNRGRPMRHRRAVDNKPVGEPGTHHYQRVFSYRRGKNKYHSDHKLRLADGGLHEEGNLQLLTAKDHAWKTGEEAAGMGEEAQDKFEFRQEDLPRSQRDLLAETQKEIKDLLAKTSEETDAVSIGPELEHVSNAYQDPEAKAIDEKKTVGKRKYKFSGKEHLPGVSLKRIIKKLNLRGRDTAGVDVTFAYIPNLDSRFTFHIADEFIAGSRGKFGMAKERLSHGDYRIVINLARFDADGVTEVIGEQAKRLGISTDELLKRIGNENLQEYAVRSVLQHEITHVNHFAWEREILGDTGTDFSSSKLGKFRRELYKAYRKEIIDFMSKDENAFFRLGIDKLVIEDNPVVIESNEEAIEFLDTLMRDAAKPAATSTERLEASRRMWNAFSELLAYQSDSMNTETWITKFKRIVKMALAKIGINVGKNDLNDLVDDLYSTAAVRDNLTAAKILRGEEAVLSEEEKLSARAREVKARMEEPRGESTIVNPDKFKDANEILRNNNVSEDVIKDITETLPIEERIVPVGDLMFPLESVFSLKYPAKDLQKRLKSLAKTDLDGYLNLVSFVETAERLYNIDIEEYPGREDINTGNAIHDLEQRIVEILGPVEIEEDAGPDYFDETSWVQAWSEPRGPRRGRTYSDQFNETMDRQAGNTETPGYTSPLSQELDRSDDAAQREYTGADSVSRPKARERTTLRNLFQHLYSRAAQTVRRHSGSSKTAGLIADMILRAPHVKQREKEAKAGRDYVQKKSMAMGEFRLEAQRALDELTNRGGVIPKKINDQLREYFLDGTIPRNGRVAAAVSQLESAIERIYAWSDRVGTKYTEDFSLRPVDGGKLPRVYDTDKVASPDGRRKLMDLLESIGIVNDPTNDKYDATDIYNIILNSGGFVSGDFTESARNIGIDGMQTQRELFERIEREISRDQLGDLLLTDYQAIIPRFVDKAIEKTVYAEMFGHKNEHLLELKQKVREEIETHNRESDTFIDPDHVMKSIDEMMDIIHHRYKVNTVPTRGRKVIQAAMNATTMASLTLVSLASMPEFFTMTALGSKNPAKFATNVMGAATYSALKGLNGMHKLLTGRVMRGYFDPKTNVGKRAKFLRELGLYDISSLGEAAAQRYVGPSFIKAGVGSTGNSLGIRALYRLYGLGNLEKGRFRARQGRALMNMDTYFEINMLTTMTQMQQMMALKNLEQNIVSDAKALSKAAKGKGMKLKSTIAQIKSNLKGYGLSESEIDELVRWYDAGHRELYDVPSEFKLDLAGPAHRFVQGVITLPSEGSLPKVFRDPRFAPFLLFKSFITTFGNTFVNTVAQRIRFAEGSGVSKKYQQGKQIAGLMGTAAAMYGAVQFAQAIGYLIKYGEDDDPWEDTVPPWAEFMRDFERTGLFGPLGSLLVQTVTPNYWSWKGKDPYDDALRDLIGPMGRQIQNIGMTAADVVQGKELDLEGRLAKAVPLTKSTPIREAIGAEPYYTKDKKGKMIRRRTLEKREEKKAAKAEAKRQTILDSIPKNAAKALDLSPHDIVSMSKKDLDKYIKDKHGIDVDGRKSKVRMLEEFLEKKQ